MPRKVTVAALEKIPTFLDQGLSAPEIANAIGCTVGTLRVKCSQMGISLRRRHCGGETLIGHLVRGGPKASPQAFRKGDVKRRKSTSSHSQPRPAERPLHEQALTLLLPPKIMDQLGHRAAQKGISDSKLAAMLLEVITRDGLFDAVLDGHEVSRTLVD